MRCMMIILLLIAGVCNAQSYRYDFGSAAPAPGVVKVMTTDLYTPQKGYGFRDTANLRSIETKKGEGAAKDYITSAQPFFFSVQLPEGNYDVKVLLGDADGVSVNTIRVENRRLMVQHLITPKNEVKAVMFTVHIRDSIIRDQQNGITTTVKLKPREHGYAHWDDQLTIEFNDSLVKVCAVEISANTKATTVFLAGNSTVVDQDREPWAAWGQMFPNFFEPRDIAIANYAESGETLKAFKGERRADKIWSMAKPGDYLFIEFAHNDQKPGGSHLDPFTTYQSTLREWIAEARKRSIIPVLVTSMHRRSFDSSGKIINTLAGYPEAMQQVAKEQEVFLVDLNAMSRIMYESWGVEGSLKAFVHFPANTFPGQDSALKDNTHFTTYGAYQLARCVVESLRGSGSPLAAHLRKDIQPFDPAKPGDWSQWYWPLSLLSPAAKPDGN